MTFRQENFRLHEVHEPPFVRFWLNRRNLGSISPLEVSLQKLFRLFLKVPHLEVVYNTYVEDMVVGDYSIATRVETRKIQWPVILLNHQEERVIHQVMLCKKIYVSFQDIGHVDVYQRPFLVDLNLQEIHIFQSWRIFHEIVAGVESHLTLDQAALEVEGHPLLPFGHPRSVLHYNNVQWVEDIR